jgi:hypothetical protein
MAVRSRLSVLIIVAALIEQPREFLGQSHPVHLEHLFLAFG